MDFSIYRSINNFAAHTSWAHWFFIGFSEYGIAIFAALLGTTWWVGRRQSDAHNVAVVAATGIGSLLALGLAQIIGNAVGRARPFTTHPQVHLLIDRTKDFSFPSDHSTVAGACAIGLLLCSRRFGIAAVITAVVMGFSRVYVGTHYVGDVLAGLILGATVTATTITFAAPLLERMIRMPSMARVARLVAGPQAAR